MLGENVPSQFTTKTVSDVDNILTSR